VTCVRPARPADVPVVARLEADCFGPDAWSEGLVHAGVAGSLPTVVYLVADEDGVVVGHAVASLAGEIAELQRIAVTGDRRRTGVASALLAEVVETASRNDADRLLLEVREDNEGAVAFYAGAGFVGIDRRPHYYADGSAAVVLGLTLTGTMAR
jgi:[ribosomal protein S18]-alanine N-acetyltransferase